MVEFFVTGIPAPARRKVKSDRWAKRPSVMAEYDWRAKVTSAALAHAPAFHALKYPVTVTLVFSGPLRGDLDNLYKSTVDALVYAKKLIGIELLKGDSVKYINRLEAYTSDLNQPGCLVKIC